METMVMRIVKSRLFSLSYAMRYAFSASTSAKAKRKNLGRNRWRPDVSIDRSVSPLFNRTEPLPECRGPASSMATSSLTRHIHTHTPVALKQLMKFSLTPALPMLFLVSGQAQCYCFSARVDCRSHFCLSFSLALAFSSHYLALTLSLSLSHSSLSIRTKPYFTVTEGITCKPLVHSCILVISFLFLSLLKSRVMLSFGLHAIILFFSSFLSHQMNENLCRLYKHHPTSPII